MWWVLLPAVGSTINNDGGSDREILIRLGKANSAFGRYRKNMDKQKHLRQGQGPAIWGANPCCVAICCYMRHWSLPCCLCRVAIWCRNMANETGDNEETLNWQHTTDGFARSCVSHGKTRWPRKEKIRALSQQGQLENDVLRERRLRWTGHMMRMEPNRIAKAAVHWIPPHGKRRQGRPRSLLYRLHNYRLQTLKQDLKR